MCSEGNDWHHQLPRENVYHQTNRIRKKCAAFLLIILFYKILLYGLEFSVKIQKIIFINKVFAILPLLHWNTPWIDSTFDLNICKSLIYTIRHRDIPVSGTPVLIKMSSKTIKNCFSTEGTVVRNLSSTNMTYEVLKQRPGIFACTAVKTKQDETVILQICWQIRNLWKCITPHIWRRT